MGHRAKGAPAHGSAVEPAPTTGPVPSSASNEPSGSRSSSDLRTLGGPHRPLVDVVGGRHPVLAIRPRPDLPALEVPADRVEVVDLRFARTHQRSPDTLRAEGVVAFASTHPILARLATLTLLLRFDDPVALPQEWVDSGLPRHALGVALQMARPSAAARRLAAVTGRWVPACDRVTRHASPRVVPEVDPRTDRLFRLTRWFSVLPWLVVLMVPIVARDTSGPPWPLWVLAVSVVGMTLAIATHLGTSMWGVYLRRRWASAESG